MQGHYVPARSQPYLIFHWMLYLTAIVITTAYSSSLVAFLSVQRLSLPFTTFEELLQSSYQLGVLAQGSHFTFFQGAKLPPYKAIYHKLIAPAEDDLPKTQIEGLNMICSRPQYSYFATEDVIKPSVKNLPCKVVKVPRTALSAALGLLHPKRSPYRGIIAYKVECLRQKGILQMLQFRTWKQDQELVAKNLRVVTFDAVSSLFLLLVMGMGTSAVTMLLEMFWERCRQRQVIRPRRFFTPRRASLRTEMSWRHQRSSNYQILSSNDMQSFRTRRSFWNRDTYNS
ncbi:glutamate receptor ionotropic, kainate glr-3 [Anabrus simplex]|uniref:glutamate receptor ionotropic, kainate glr-3 n=1 Tax=Anabrus simplex TaxID=316456 RepID=UPI0035A27057